MQLDDLNLLTIRCFLAAAKHLNFRAAAASMHMSPAAFGKRIATLETQLGAKLFERSTRRVMLSTSGLQAVPRASRLLAECARLTQELSEPVPVSYSLTIATRFELGLSWITPALDELARVQPNRTIHLSFGDGADMIARVQSGEVDAAVTSSRQRPRGVRRVDLHDEAYVFVGSVELLAERPLRTPADAAEHTLLDIGPTRPLFRYLVEDKRSLSSWSFKQTQYLGTIASIRQRVLGGHGVAVLPLYFVARDLEQKTLAHVDPSAVLESDAFRLVWLADNPQGDHLEELAADLRAIPLA